MNNVTLVGRLVRDVEVGSSGVGRFTLAVDRAFKGRDGQKQTDFIRCTAWGQSAEFLAKYSSKGRLVSVVGSIRVSEYSDKDGNNRTSVEVNADRVALLDSQREPQSAIPDGLVAPTKQAQISDDDDLFGND